MLGGRTPELQAGEGQVPFSIMFICISNQKLIDRKGLHLLGIEEGTEELKERKKARREVYMRRI